MEPIARQKYMEITKNEVIQVGLVVRNDISWLAGSPDGLFVDQAGNTVLLEIKCPISNQDQQIFVKYLDLNVDTMNHELNRKDAQGKVYYTQVQLLMFLCGAKKCDFFVYSSVDHTIVSIEYDKTYT